MLNRSEGGCNLTHGGAVPLREPATGVVIEELPGGGIGFPHPAVGERVRLLALDLELRHRRLQMAEVGHHFGNCEQSLLNSLLLKGLSQWQHAWGLPLKLPQAHWGIRSSRGVDLPNGGYMHT